MSGYGSFIEGYDTTADDHTPSKAHGGAAAEAPTQPENHSKPVTAKAVTKPPSVNQQIQSSRAAGKAGAGSQQQGYLAIDYNGTRPCPGSGCGEQQVQVIRGVGKCHCGHVQKVHRRSPPATASATTVFLDEDGDGNFDARIDDFDGDGTADAVSVDTDGDNLIDAILFRGAAGLKGTTLTKKAGGVVTHAGKRPVIVKGGASAEASSASSSPAVKDQWVSRAKAAAPAGGKSKSRDITLHKLPGDGKYRMTVAE